MSALGQKRTFRQFQGMSVRLGPLSAMSGHCGQIARTAFAPGLLNQPAVFGIRDQEFSNYSEARTSLACPRRPLSANLLKSGRCQLCIHVSANESWLVEEILTNVGRSPAGRQ